jgi:hypothetical protein
MINCSISDLTEETLMKLRGRVCAIEHQTGNLLAHGSNWEEVEETLRKQGDIGRSYYRFAIPSRAQIDPSVARGVYASQ